MKPLSFYMRIIAPLVAIAMMPLMMHGQSVYQYRNASFWHNWSVNMNAGISSYYGDLSLHDDDIVGKLQYESKPGASLIINKSVNHGVCLSGQLLYAGLKGQKGNLQMQSQLIEYNFQIRLNLVDVFKGKSNNKIGFIVFAGAGNFVFNTDLTELNEGESVVKNFKSRVPEFVHFYGGGFSYAVSDNIAITADLSLHMFQNDKIDGVAAGHQYDYYSYLGIGITQKINTYRPRNQATSERMAKTNTNTNHSPIYRPGNNFNQSLRR